MEISRPYDNVFEALEDDLEVARNLAIRATLMRELERYIEREGLTQAQAAERLGVTQPRISDLVRGKIDLFTIDALVNLLARVGLGVSVDVQWGSAKGAPIRSLRRMGGHAVSATVPQSMTRTHRAGEESKSQFRTRPAGEKSTSRSMPQTIEVSEQADKKKGRKPRQK